MAEIKPFPPVKLVCGIIAAGDECFARAEERLIEAYGPIDERSPRLVFNQTSYYEGEMGADLRRGFLSFAELIDPARLAAIKIETNTMEAALRAEFQTKRRIVNLDPGCLTAAALIMGTAKDFSHRVPLADGIYAHLEFIFTKTGIRLLDWTYPDFRGDGYREFFLRVRRTYLNQRRGAPDPLSGPDAPPGGG
jgi:hypothetical protein